MNSLQNTLKVNLKLAGQHAELVRVRDLLDILVIYVLGILISSPNGNYNNEFILVGLAISCSLFFTHIINDIYDIDVDRSNKRNRPLVTGTISVKSARNLAIYYCLVALIAAYLAGTIPFLVILFLLLIGFSYSYPSFGFSRKGFLGTLNILLGYFIAPYLLGVYLNTGSFFLNGAEFLLIAGVTLSGIGRIFLKDFGDLKGDKLHGKVTPLQVIGKIKTFFVVTFLSVFGAILSLAFILSFDQFDSISKQIAVVSIVATNFLLALTAWRLLFEKITIDYLYYSMRLALLVLLLLLLCPRP